MSRNKNCSLCSQHVGKLDDNTWIFYKEVGITHNEKNACIDYNCVNCLDIAYHRWRCHTCETIYNKDEEFCDKGGCLYCIKCLTYNIILTNQLLTCKCMVCQNRQNNLFLKKQT
jgi:hypothetical protein